MINIYELKYPCIDDTGYLNKWQVMSSCQLLTDGTRFTGPLLLRTVVFVPNI